MPVEKDGQIEYWLALIQELVYEIKDARSNQEKLDEARDLETQIQERIDAENLDEEYSIDVITRVRNLIDILKKKWIELVSVNNGGLGEWTIEPNPPTKSEWYMSSYVRV